MTREQINKRKKERRTLKKSLIIEITGDSKLATSLRDKGNEYLLNRFSDLKLINGKLSLDKSKRKSKKKDKIEPIEVEQDFTSVKIESDFIKKETRKEKRKRLYKEARESGYTPEEARELRDKAQTSFNETIQFNKVLNVDSRYKKWSVWGKEVGRIEKKINKAEEEGKSASYLYDLEVRKDNIYPSYIMEEVKRINIDKGLDPNASYGWSVYYYYYTEGGTLEWWESFLMADPLNPNIYRAKTTFIVSVENKGRKIRK